MEQTVTMMSEEETPEVGPNDIVIHLVNPFKCGICELEFLDKSIFKEHMFNHLEQIKQERPSSQIVMTVILPPETPGGVTVTRDILQLGEDGSIKQVIQPSDSMASLTKVAPLRTLEEAGVIKLDQPKPVNIATPKHGTIRRPGPTFNLAQPNQTMSLISSEVASLSAPEQNGVEGLLADNQVKDENKIDPEVSELVENKDGSYSFAFKGPNNELQHIQILRSDGIKSDLLVEFASNETPKQRRMPRGTNKINECDLCGKVLSSATNLIRHKMYHSAERPFVCEVCNKGFKDVSNLKKHTMIHKRIFPCHLCKKSFLRKSLLAMHLKRHEARTTVVRAGSAPREVTVRTFMDEHGTRVEELSMAALVGLTFENQRRLIKVDAESITKKDAEGDESVAEEALEFEMDSDKTSEGVKSAPSLAIANGLQLVDETTEAAVSSGMSLDAADVQIPSAPEEFVKMYQCGHCGKRAAQRGNMMRHLIHHLKEKPWTCDECSKSFVDKGELVKHKKTHSKPYKCPLCNGAFAHNVQLVKHVQSDCLGSVEQLNYTVLEDGKTYKCDICRITMKRLGNMIKHVGSHNIGSSRSGWNRKSIFRPNFVHLPSSTGEVRENKPDTPFYYDSSRRAFFCGFCSKSFSQKTHVLRHIKVHTKERPFKCKICNCFFPNSHTLERHALIHSKPFKCDECLLAFSRKIFLDAHKSKHTRSEGGLENSDYRLLANNSGYCCKHCGLELRKLFRMMNHVKRHTTNRSFECDVCNKCFTNKYMMIKHKKNHNRPFFCRECGESFSNKLLLKNHRKKMHPKPAVFPVHRAIAVNEKSTEEFKCSFCNLNFNRRVIRNNHEKRCQHESKIIERFPDDSGYKCKICGKVSTLKHNLMAHIRKHKEVKLVEDMKSGFSVLVTDADSDSITEELRNDPDSDPKDPNVLDNSERTNETPSKKARTFRFDENSDSDDDRDPAEEFEDLENVAEESAYVKRTVGGYACRMCRRKFTDLDTLKRHLQLQHGVGEVGPERSQTESQENSTPEKIKNADDEENNQSEVERVKMETDTDLSKEEDFSSSKPRLGSTKASPDTNPKSDSTAFENLVKILEIPRARITPKPESSKQPKKDTVTPSRSSNRPSRTLKMPSRYLDDVE